MDVSPPPPIMNVSLEVGTKSQVTGADSIEKDDIQGGERGIRGGGQRFIKKGREIKLSREKAINMHGEAD